MEYRIIRVKDDGTLKDVTKMITRRHSFTTQGELEESMIEAYHNAISDRLDSKTPKTYKQLLREVSILAPFLFTQDLYLLSIDEHGNQLTPINLTGTAIHVLKSACLFPFIEDERIVTSRMISDVFEGKASRNRAYARYVYEIENDTDPYDIVNHLNDITPNETVEKFVSNGPWSDSREFVILETWFTDEGEGMISYMRNELPPFSYSIGSFESVEDTIRGIYKPLDSLIDEILRTD